MIEFAPLIVLILVMAVLYSSVGHGGASGYLAAMALFGLAPEAMKPAALSMNIAVASLVVWRFYRGGLLPCRLIAPFVALSIPMAYLGGGYQIDAQWYKLLVGASLLLAATWLVFKPHDRPAVGTPPLWASLTAGAGLGLLSGVTGVGGGIFLSPLLLLLRWTDMRSSAGVAAVFILVNSIAGLLGFLSAGGGWTLPVPLPVLVTVVLLGALIGSELSLRRVKADVLRRFLGAVLVVAGGKMVLTAV